MKFKTLSLSLMLLSSLSLTACVTTNTQLGQGNFEVGKQNFINGDYFQAYKNLEPVAKAGNPEAQYAIGYMYFYGLGTAQDKALAIQWMNAAAAQGNLHAKQALQDIQQHTEFSGMQPFPGRLPSSSFVTQPRPTYNGGPGQGGQEAYQEDPSGNSAGGLQATWPPPKDHTNAPQTMDFTEPATQGVDTTPISAEPVPSYPITQEPPVLLPNTPPPVNVAPMSFNTPSKGYTVQILAAHEEAKLMQYIQEKNLQGKTTTYQIQRDGKNWYVLGYGNYPTLGEAEKAASNLPADLKKTSPWVRNIAKLSPLDNSHLSNVG